MRPSSACHAAPYSASPHPQERGQTHAHIFLPPPHRLSRSRRRTPRPSPTYAAAPGQEFLALGEYKPSFPGATVAEPRRRHRLGALSRSGRRGKHLLHRLRPRPEFHLRRSRGSDAGEEGGRLPGGRGHEGRRRPHLSGARLQRLDLPGDARSGGEDVHGHECLAAENAGRQADRRPDQSADDRQDRQAARRRRQADRAGHQRDRRGRARAARRRPLLHRRGERDRHRRSVAGGRRRAPLRSGRHGRRFRQRRLSGVGQHPGDLRQAHVQPRDRVALDVGGRKIPLRAGAEPARQPGQQGLRQRHQHAAA